MLEFTESQTTQLLSLGWNPYFEAQRQLLEESGDYLPARIIAEKPPGYIVKDADGRELWADVPGKWRYASERREDLPAIGDWVLIEPRRDDDTRALLRNLLDRKTCVLRRAVGGREESQIIAANVDTAFIVTSLNADLNLRRLERYLALVWDSGAVPVILLSKADLAKPEAEAQNMRDLESIAKGTPVIPFSSITGAGLVDMEPLLAYGKSFVVIGSSGVGKSTLVNKLMGREVMLTSAIREGDDKGRHTTTSRHLFTLPGGAILIDTPGMRELALYDAGDGLETVFKDVIEIATGCRFSDCRHENEPGCAIQAAIKAGALTADRVESYNRLDRERAFQARKLDKVVASRDKGKNKAISRSIRARKKDR